MADERILATVFPGAGGVIDAVYTLSNGYSPGIIHVRVLPGSEITGIGDVILSDGRNSIRIPQCRVESAAIDMSSSGQVLSLAIADRRWMWRYGSISGHYNIPAVRIFDVPYVADFNQQLGNLPAPDPALTPDQYVPQLQSWTVKSAQDLGKLLMIAMGEQSFGFDVSALPRDQYPEVNWEAANPAFELQRLAELFGCRLNYNPFTNRASVVRIGAGADLPAADASELNQAGQGIDPPQLPAYATCYGAPILYQVMFEMEAVAREFDGRVKLIDDVSYRPTLGWSSLSPPFNMTDDSFAPGQLPADRTRFDASALATEDVYRLYRIKRTIPVRGDDNVFCIPADSYESGNRFRREDIVLTPFLVETAYATSGNRLRMPAEVFGKAIRAAINWTTTTENQQIRIGFDVIEEYQCIRFNEPVYFADVVAGAEVSSPATCYLVCGVMVRDPDTHQLRRYRRSTAINLPGRTPAAGNPGEYAILRDDVRLTVRTDYTAAESPADAEVSKTETNKPEADAKADYHIAAELARFQVRNPQDVVYNGLKPVAVDGAIWQVTWESGPRGAKTRASRNNEHSVIEDPYAFKRHRENQNVELEARDRTLKLALAERKVDLFYGSG